MKILSNLLALCLPLGTAAFTITPTAPKIATRLFSAPPPRPPPPPPPPQGGPGGGAPGSTLSKPSFSGPRMEPTGGAGGQGSISRVKDSFMWNPASVVRVEGSTLRTWMFRDIACPAVSCVLETEGRPLTADVELWIGPDWTPVSYKVYSEDGRQRPVRLLIGTRNRENAVAIRNTHTQEFPLSAACLYAKPPLADVTLRIPEMSASRRVQGGAVYTTPFPSTVEQVQVLLNTDGRQLNARVELLNGPNNIKQTVEIFTNNGQANPLYIVFETPGAGNTVRIVNLATVEFPCEAWIGEA